MNSTRQGNGSSSWTVREKRGGPGISVERRKEKKLIPEPSVVFDATQAEAETKAAAKKAKEEAEAEVAYAKAEAEKKAKAEAEAKAKVRV